MPRTRAATPPSLPTAGDLASAMADHPATHDVVLAAVVLVGLARLVDGPLVWLVAACALAAISLGTLQVLGESSPAAEAAGVPLEHILLPAAATVASIGALQLVPLGIWLIPAVAAAGLLIARALAIEGRILAAPATADPAERNSVLALALVVAFLGFAGVAALVPGGLAEPGSTGTPPAPASGDLAMLAGADAFLALLLGYRSAALRTARVRDVAWFAVTSASAVAIAAVALRVIAVPRLAGPALLTLVLFLWEAMHGTPPARRRDARRLWELLLLVVLGVVVVAWSQLGAR